jgi:hypothetical protein
MLRFDVTDARDAASPGVRRLLSHRETPTRARLRLAVAPLLLFGVAALGLLMDVLPLVPLRICSIQFLAFHPAAATVRPICLAFTPPRSHVATAADSRSR